MTVAKLTQDAVLRVGEVVAVEGRKVFVLVDKNKNLSDMFLDGEILRNLSVNSYIEIRKGFLSLNRSSRRRKDRRGPSGTQGRV